MSGHRQGEQAVQRDCGDSGETIFIKMGLMKIYIMSQCSYCFLKERMIESQNFVMTNLRNGIDYLKATCKNAGDGDGILSL